MNEKTKRRVLTVYGCALGVLLIVVGILFITSCVGIYNSGDRPFTRASIAAAFAKISVPIYLAIAATVIGGVLKLALSVQEKKNGQLSISDALKIATRKLSLDACSSEQGQKINRERFIRKLIFICGGVLLALSLLYPFIYIFSPELFPADSAHNANSEIIGAVTVVGICLVPVTVYSVIASLFIEKSKARELKCVKEVLKNASAKNDLDAKDEKCCALKLFFKKNKRVISIASRSTAVAVGVLLVVLGINNGGMADVLEKAVKICTECIGLG